MPVSFTINGKPITIDADPAMPLLWAIRDFAGLTGTKFSCGIGQCGACIIHLDGNAIRSCVVALRAAENKSVQTIEGLSENNDHPVQKAWAEIDVPQCGYCQSGQIMATAALLSKTPKPTDEQIDVAMRGVLCRCGTYPRIKQAIKKAAGL